MVINLIYYVNSCIHPLTKYLFSAHDVAEQCQVCDSVNVAWRFWFGVVTSNLSSEQYAFEMSLKSKG
jgi:hypothetical protein